MVKNWQKKNSSKKQNFFARIFNKKSKNKSSDREQEALSVPLEVEMATDNEQQKSLLDNDTLGEMNANNAH